MRQPSCVELGPYWYYLTTHTELTRTAEAALRKLQQGQGTVASYAAQFCLTANTDWNEAAQVGQFRWGLQEEIKDKLGWVQIPMSLDTLMNLAICIDNWSQE